MVHHMLLYELSSAAPVFVSDDFSDFQSGYYACDMVVGNPMWGYAPGAPSFDSPPQAGFRVGPGKTIYATLQIHFDNPQGIANIIDSSGLLMYATTQLR